MLIIIDKIIYWDNHETILFAVEELRRLMREAGYESTIGDQAAFTESNENHNRIILITTNEYHSLGDMKKTITINDDGFALLDQRMICGLLGMSPVRFSMAFICIVESSLATSGLSWTKRQSLNRIQR